MSIESEILRIQHNIANTYAAVSNKGGEVPLQPTSESLPAAVESIPQGPTYTAGDGIEITQTEAGPKIGVTTPVRGIVSQEEFDALTEAEQNKGLYVISDSGGSGGGGDSGTGSPALEVYSTEETRIGTWIDGKPIYRKVITGTVAASAQNSFSIPSAGFNAEFYVNIHGIVRYSENEYIFVSSYNNASLNTTSISFGANVIYIDTGNIKVASKPYYVIVEYTKTTDEGVTA